MLLGSSGANSLTPTCHHISRQAGNSLDCLEEDVGDVSSSGGWPLKSPAAVTLQHRLAVAAARLTLEQTKI